MRRFAVLALLCLLAACGTPRRVPPLAPVAPPPVVTPVAPVVPPIVAAPKTALEIGVRAGPALTELPGWAEADLAPSLATFRKSCRVLARRADPSGLTTAADWTAVCANQATDARAFFEGEFGTIIVGEGTGLNTGYFEPELIGALTNQPGSPFPVYKRPPELVEVDLGQFAESLKGKRIRGRVANATLVPYFDRAEIEDGALAGRGLEVAWVADPYELFFLHIQGSGRVRLADGNVLRIGYDGQNGRDYVGIGKLLRDRNLLGKGQASMDGIISWMKANPEAGKALMRENGSYIFFKLLTGDGPLGALNIALTPALSVAADPAFTPLGAPLWLDTSIPEPAATPPGYAMTPFRALMVAQDTGGAIKGANRFDLFWGPGDRARKIAGGLSSTGRAVFLLPKAAVARLLANGTPARP